MPAAASCSGLLYGDSHLAKATTRDCEVLPKVLPLEIGMIRPPEDVAQRDTYPRGNERVQGFLFRTGKLPLSPIAAQEGRSLDRVPGATRERGNGGRDIAGERPYRAIREVDGTHGTATEQIVALVEVTMQNPNLRTLDVAQERAGAIDPPPEPCKRGRSEVGMHRARERQTIANERTPIRVGKAETSGKS